MHSFELKVIFFNASEICAELSMVYGKLGVLRLSKKKLNILLPSKIKPILSTNSSGVKYNAWEAKSLHEQVTTNGV